MKTVFYFTVMPSSGAILPSLLPWRHYFLLLQHVSSSFINMSVYSINPLILVPLIIDSLFNNVREHVVSMCKVCLGYLTDLFILIENNYPNHIGIFTLLSFFLMQLTNHQSKYIGNGMV